MVEITGSTLGVGIAVLLLLVAVVVLRSRGDLLAEDHEYIEEYRMETRRDAKTRSP